MRHLALFLLAVGPVWAHEFWLQPSPALAAPGDRVTLALRVGMSFQGEPRPFSRELITDFHRVTAAGISDELSRVPATAAADLDLSLPLASAGTHLLWVDTIAKPITLEPAKFNDYLREDGLDHVLALRTAAGQSDTPGRERYARCIKALVRVGPVSDDTYAVRTGQRLELVPQSDPFAVRPGASLAFVTTFDGRPLSGALVRAWHRDGDRLTELTARTDPDGDVRFTLPAPGAWMISVVHMIAATDLPGCDWQSFWGNLTFTVPAP